MKKTFVSTLTAISLLTSAWTAQAQTNAEPSAEPVGAEKPASVLPATTGPYPVGATTFDWLDTSREEWQTADPGDYRELKVQVWYPMDSSTGLEQETYIPATAKGIEQMMASWGLGEPFAAINGLDTQVWHNGILSNQEEKYPVVLFSHGLGNGSWNYQWLTRELASQGYVVVSVDHTHFSFGTEFADGRYVPILPQWVTGIPHLEQMDKAIDQVWVKDLQFVIRQLEALNQTDDKQGFMHSLDLENIAAVGHSFGGAAAARALQVEPRIKAAVNIDGAFVGMTGESAKLTKPFAFMATEENHKMFRGEAEQPLPPGLDEQTVREMKEMFGVFRNRYAEAVDGAAYDITIAGATHMSFTDLPLLQPYLAGSPFAALPQATAKPEQLHALSNSVIRSFLEKTLRDKQDTLLDVEAKRAGLPGLRIEHK